MTEGCDGGGWAQDGAVRDQIDDRVMGGVFRARGRMTAGDGETDCVECEEAIPEGRRRAVPGVRTCVLCQSGLDVRVRVAGINRRGSEDSRLK